MDLNEKRLRYFENLFVLFVTIGLNLIVTFFR